MRAPVFRERELIWRAGDRVRVLSVRPAWQIAAVAAVVMLVAWGAVGSTVVVLQRDVLQREAERLAQSRLAYDDLVAEMEVYQRKVAEVTGKLKANQADLLAKVAEADALGALPLDAAGVSRGGASRAVDAPGDLRRQLGLLDGDLQEMTAVNDMLEDSVTSIRADLAAVQAERAKVYEARAALKHRVQELESTVTGTRNAAARLRGRIAALDEELAGARAAAESERQARAAADKRIVSAEAARRGLLARQEALRDEVARVERAREAALERHAELGQERARLEVRIAGLEEALSAATDRGNRLQSSLREVADRLQLEIGEAEPESAALMPLPQRVGALLDRLADLRSVRGSLIEGLSARASVGIEDAERVIARAGLDVEKLLGRVTADMPTGQGGPFVSFQDTAPGSLGSQVAGLDGHLVRLESLRAALRAMPLVAPVDQYRITSSFGKRQDPVTSKWAVHSGVDLGGYPKSAVRAVAPGRVVLAGWNGDFGRMVEIDHGLGFRTRYAHLHSITVKRGETVAHRQKIGLLGSSGRSTGPHVHYEVMFEGEALDPLNFIEAGRNVFK